MDWRPRSKDSKKVFELAQDVEDMMSYLKLLDLTKLDPASVVGIEERNKALTQWESLRTTSSWMACASAWTR